MVAAATAPQRGFIDPVHDAQRAFKSVMDAMAQPGRSYSVDPPSAAPAPLHPAAAALMLTLLDYDTPVYLEPELQERSDLLDFIAFNTGAPLTIRAEKAAFAVAGFAGAFPDPGLFAQGTAEYPDRSTTLILGLPDRGLGTEVTLSGPGIDGGCSLALEGVVAGYWRSLVANRQHYPLGVDVIFTRSDSVVCLPRSTRIAIPEA